MFESMACVFSTIIWPNFDLSIEMVRYKFWKLMKASNTLSLVWIKVSQVYFNFSLMNVTNYLWFFLDVHGEVKISEWAKSKHFTYIFDDLGNIDLQCLPSIQTLHSLFLKEIIGNINPKTQDWWFPNLACQIKLLVIVIHSRNIIQRIR